MKKILLFTCLTLPMLGSLWPVDKKEISQEHPPLPAPKPKDRILFLPIVYYTPETNMALGMASSFIFRLSRDKAARPSSISPLIVYTTKKQFKLDIKADVFMGNDDYHLMGELKVQHYPDKFFGIGDQTRAMDQEGFTSQGSDLTFDLSRKFKRHWFAGLRYHINKWYIDQTLPGGMLASGGIFGSRGGWSSGLALRIIRDSRDNIYFPESGEYIEISAAGYSHFLGSDYAFQSLKLNARRYIPVHSGQVLALQAMFTLQSGEVPFMHLATLGGQSTLRGYFEGRFRDRNLAALQAEYRLHLFWRLKMVGFAGIGDVASTPGGLSLQNARYSAGMGLRYLFSKAEKITLRLDAAFGKGSSGFYFSIFEAF